MSSWLPEVEGWVKVAGILVGVVMAILVPVRSGVVEDGGGKDEDDLTGFKRVDEFGVTQIVRADGDDQRHGICQRRHGGAGEAPEVVGTVGRGPI